MISLIFGFGLARPIFLAAVLALIPILIWQWRTLTHFPAYMKVLLLCLRIGVVLTIVFALAGPQRIEQNFRKYVLFAVDQSGSVPNGGFDVHKSILDEALKNKNDNQYAVLSFAGQPGAVSTRPLKPENDKNSQLELLDVSHTDYSKATVLAEAIVPEDSVGEVVIISDFQSADDAPEIHKQVNQFGISAYRIDISEKSVQPEICIETISAPQRARVGQPIVIEVLVKSNIKQKAVVTLNLQNNDKENADENSSSELGSQLIDFTRSGMKSVHFEFTPSQSQAYVFEAQLTNAEGTELSDTLSANNRYYSATSVLPQGKVLLVENKKNLAAPLSKALAGEYLTVTPCSADKFPQNLDQFEAVILSNIPATALSEENQTQLESYVNAGGGLIALGGDQSFTAGGWHGTKLEELMPVECIPQEKQPRRSLALVLVLDRSESMNEGDAIDLARQGAKRALKVLAPTDELGILTYEDNYVWNVPLTQVPEEEAELENINNKIDEIKAQGRTNLYPALKRACQALEESFSDLKHIIVLTDGVSQPGDFEALAKEIASKGISMSTVAVGEEADPQILSDLARHGKGSTYICKNPKDLPDIFALETTSVAKMGIIEGSTFKIKTVSSLSALGKFDAGQSPPLLGYVQTQIKQDATVIYSAPEINGIPDPILSWIRYKKSKGVVVAFTSDVESRWSSVWQQWDGFGPFWSRLVNFVRRPDSADQYSILTDNKTITVKGSVAQADVKCSLTDSAGKNYQMNQVAPGVFKLDALPALGESQVDVIQNGKVVWTGKAGIVQNYTDEFRPDRSSSLDESSLPPKIEVSSIFDKSEKSVPKTYRYWQYLLWLGVLMTVAEVFLRRTGIA